MDSPHLIIAVQEPNTRRALCHFADKAGIPYMTPLGSFIEASNGYMEGAGALFISHLCFPEGIDPKVAISTLREQSQNRVLICICVHPSFKEINELGYPLESPTYNLLWFMISAHS